MPNLDTTILELIASHNPDAFRDMQVTTGEIDHLAKEKKNDGPSLDDGA